MPQEAPPGAEEVAKAEEEAPLEADVAGEAVKPNVKVTLVKHLLELKTWLMKLS